MAGLTIQEIMKVVNRYIGVSGGYLGDFSYRTHAEFYYDYCNLDIDPYIYEGTTRQRFIAILEVQTPSNQAKILRGVINRFPPEAANAPSTRTLALQSELLNIINRLEQNSPIPNPSPKITSDLVKQAIVDTETLLQSSGAVSAIDRIHTALHAYLREVCKSADISYTQADSITKLLRFLRQQHPALQRLSSKSQDIERILQNFGSVLDSLSTIRNNSSLAHANEELLERDEAMLAINAARTIIHYLDAKLSS